MKTFNKTDLPGGDGSHGFKRGSVVLNMAELRVGDLLIDDNQQFNATNVIEIVALNHFPHQPGQIVTARFYGRGSQTHSIWHWELQKGEYRLATYGGRAVNTVLQSVESRREEMAKAVAKRERARAMRRKTWAVCESGERAGWLAVLPWRFSNPDARMPHRIGKLATAELPGNNSVSVYSARRGGTWWLAGTGPGWAGDRSKAINTVMTKSRAVFEKWVAAVQAGKVEILNTKDTPFFSSQNLEVA